MTAHQRAALARYVLSLLVAWGLAAWATDRYLRDAFGGWR